MRADFVLLLSGPSGSGKSTTALAWADSRTAPTAVIDMDKIRWFVRVGRAVREDGWTEEAERQWRLAMKQTGQLARTYVDAGFSCVIDVFAPPNEICNAWDDELTDLDVRKVYLNPTYEACSRRNAQRVGDGKMTEDELRDNFDKHRAGLEQRRPPRIIDNTELTVLETVNEIGRLIGT